jgi:hypothetical protein
MHRIRGWGTLAVGETSRRESGLSSFIVLGFWGVETLIWAKYLRKTGIPIAPQPRPKAIGIILQIYAQDREKSSFPAFFIKLRLDFSIKKNARNVRFYYSVWAKYSDGDPIGRPRLSFRTRHVNSTEGLRTLSDDRATDADRQTQISP